jgi:hypothetical protein
MVWSVAAWARKIDDDLSLVGASFVFDGGEGAKEEIGGVSHDGTAARSDLVPGEEFVKFAEGMVDGDGIPEFLDVADEDSGEVGLIEFFLMVGGVFGAEAGLRIGNGHAAVAAAGSAMPTMERNGV